MRIEQDMPGRLKVSLKKEDMQKLSLDLDHLDYNDDRTREVLQMLLRDAGKLAGFSHCGRLLIEAFPTPSEGCILYFTCLEKEKPRRLQIVRNESSPYIFGFDSCEEAIKALLAVKKQSGLTEKCQLYHRENGGYAVVIYLTPAQRPQLEALLSEFGTYLGRGRAAAARESEHGELLSENALDIF